jgi:hypothetical protein
MDWFESVAKKVAREQHQLQLTCSREHRASWVVVQYRCNFSAFNGYHQTPSDYSCCRCDECGRVWRTKAAYVDTLPFTKE